MLLFNSTIRGALNLVGEFKIGAIEEVNLGENRDDSDITLTRENESLKLENLPTSLAKTVFNWIESNKDQNQEGETGGEEQFSFLKKENKDQLFSESADRAKSSDGGADQSPHKNVSGSGFSKRNSPYKDFFAFKKLISTTIIRYMYFIGALIITVGLFVTPLTGDYSGEAFALFWILGIPVGNIIWRIICENLIVIFDIHDTLVSIDEKLEETG